MRWQTDLYGLTSAASVRCVRVCAWVVIIISEYVSSASTTTSIISFKTPWSSLTHYWLEWEGRKTCTRTHIYVYIVHQHHDSILDLLFQLTRHYSRARDEHAKRSIQAETRTWMRATIYFYLAHRSHRRHRMSHSQSQIFGTGDDYISYSLDWTKLCTPTGASYYT